METGCCRMASELEPLEDVLAGLPAQWEWAIAVLRRVARVTRLPDHPRILDVGAGSGRFLVTCAAVGYTCEGIDPCPEARQNADRLSRHLGIPIRVVDGVAEAIPYEPDAFDVVHASSVIEHVRDLDLSFQEIYRVLKPGGVFWFNTASSLCPRQDEIRGFPLFGWYPDVWKRRIMNWAKDNRPELVGYTRSPAVHWFTPAKACSLLQRHGFRRVYDRWDLRGEDEGGNLYRLGLVLIRSSGLTRTLADIMVPGCSYAAVK